MKMGMHLHDVIFFDLETSGLDPKRHEIIQIAMIHAPTGDSLELKMWFDETKASEEALRVNHYDVRNLGSREQTANSH